MRSNYNLLGNYIREVNKRDVNIKVDKLLGISNQKKFIDSIANTIGTDMSTYKIIRKNQFAYVAVTSRNGDKISVCLLEDYDEAIVSQAYTVFEVIDTEKLLPEYLMMWFRRPEFDRYARFMSHGSAREIFSWEEMCNMELPVPDIAKQREIVKEYNVLVNRIALNNQLNQKLEETAQAIYKQWFVDFEFPDEDGKPYKSNGGEMVESELGDIPKGWKVGCLFDLIELQRGFDLPVQNRKQGSYPIYASTGITEKHNEYKVKSPGIVTGRSGSLGQVFYVDEDFFPLNTTLWVKEFKNATPIFTFYVLNSINIIDYNSGSAVPTLNRNHIHIHKLIVPKMEIIRRFEMLEKNLFIQTKSLKDQQDALGKFKDILLSKLATIED
ncbi:restriction endonuclease subunit S [Planktothrix agardhii]|uniref:restriction endonuclease subunit S n=1 Tax=Planktothrix agardhii TaxID=1160 RepID=UPI001D0A0B80|nr:restriction endonuclease subunit S [Planktothrix agardhii]MCB8762209.1 restriction endonuclease subunit S [Planktothrix agardhii 1813]